MQWLSSLWNSFTSWLGSVWEWFVKWLINLLELLWDVFIASILWQAFGSAFLLYVIFYILYSDVIMEAWNPNSNQSSERIKLKEAPSGTPLTDRQGSKVHELTR
ncbi:MAG: hypothetical protein PT119_25920 [Aphanizomenon gracile PMC627.10]|nr:hypothetical protein [Aphanizomenon gracile PMC627.10]